MKERLDVRNGYLYSGVISNLDEDGFLKITDRKKKSLNNLVEKTLLPQ
ncbi:MAG: hypothetical protein MK076_07585 [Flavobacteriales bacterium]|nr:hypothetical protein [Flavobacteriales bacterium]